MKRALTVTVAILVLVIAGGLFFLTYYPERAQNVLIPDIEQLKSVEIRLGTDTLYATLNLRMHNKGIFKMNLDSISYKINFDTMRVLSKVQDLQIVLSPGDADTFKLPLAVPFKRLAGRIKELQERDSADIKSEIRLVYSTIWGRASLPHEKTSRIGMPRPPEVELEKVEYLGRNKKVLHLMATVRFTNKGGMTLMVSGLKYKMTFKDHFIAEGHVDKTINITPRSTFHHKLPVEVNLQNPLKTAMLIIRDKDLLPYTAELEGIFSSGEVMNNTRITVTKRGKLELRK